jgi:hypothetical protein
VHHIFSLILGKTVREGGDPCFGDIVRQDEVEQIRTRDGALCGKIREVDAQGLARDEIRGISWQEMNATDDCVCLNDELVARGGDDYRHIIEQTHMPLDSLLREARNSRRSARTRRPWSILQSLAAPPGQLIAIDSSPIVQRYFAEDEAH